MGITGPHFSDSELECHGKTCGPSGTGCHVNGCTQGLIDALEAFRALVGKPVIPDDCYRCPQHNREVGGVGKSEHMLGLAADIRVEGMTAGQLEAIARKILAIRGIGRADHAQYLHVDVRPTLTLAAWCYDLKGAVIPYYTSSDAQINA